MGLAGPGSIFSYNLRYIVGFGLVEMAISTNPKPTIYRNLYENTGPGEPPEDGEMNETTVPFRHRIWNSSPAGRSEAEHATSRRRMLPTILNVYE